METENSEIQKIFRTQMLELRFRGFGCTKSHSSPISVISGHIRSEISCAECHGDIGQSDQAVKAYGLRYGLVRFVS